MARRRVLDGLSGADVRKIALARQLRREMTPAERRPWDVSQFEFCAPHTPRRFSGCVCCFIFWSRLARLRPAFTEAPWAHLLRFTPGNNRCLTPRSAGLRER